MIDWAKGYSAISYMTRVDPVTWRDTERIEITGGSIGREPSGLRQSADLDCVDYPEGVEQWVRVWMDVRQDGSHAHEALFTGLATSPDTNIDHGRRAKKLQCYSVLKPADDVLLRRGWYAPSESDGAELVRQLLSVSPAPITIEGEPKYLTSAIVAEMGETNLTMAEAILTAMNWHLRIAGDGSIVISPLPETESAIFDPNDNDVVETEISLSADWYDCPNCLMAVADDMTAVARDDSAGALSTVSRGREVWTYEDGVDLADNESIAEYATRRLRELQRYERTADYDRRYMPELYPGDLVRLHYPQVDLQGLYRIESQSIEIGYNCRTSETVTEVN